MNKKFKVVLILLLLLAVLPLLPATNYQLLTVRADWNTDFNKPTCTFINSPGSSQTAGNSVEINLWAANVNYVSGTGVTEITVKNSGGNVVASTIFPAPYPQPGKLTWTNTTTGDYTIIGKTYDNATGNWSDYCSTTYKITSPPPAPAACFNSTWNKAYIWTGGNCYMNWWDSRCAVSLYDWVNPWTMTNFYVKAHDNWNGWDWTVCDTKWGSWGLCTRNWSTGYSSQSIAFNNPYYTIGTKYSLIQRTTDWNNRQIETEVANTCTSGYRYQMPAPNIQYDYTLTNSGTCLASNATNSSLARIYFPNSNPARQINWVDISEDFNFSTYYNKSIPAGATYTDAPIGFNGASGVSGPLTIQPDHTYYVRLFGYDASSNWSTYWFNGSYGWHSAAAIIRLPLCPASVDGKWDTADAAWNTTCNQCGTGYKTRFCNTPEPANGGTECKRINGTLTTPFNRWENCNLNPCPVPGVWSGWGACLNNQGAVVTCGGGIETNYCTPPLYGGAECTREQGTINAGTLTTPADRTEKRLCKTQACLTPWVQTEGGDVHSNTRINAPGGP